MIPAPKIEADKELDEIIGTDWLMPENRANFVAALLQWRNKAVVAGITEEFMRIPMSAFSDESEWLEYRDGRLSELTKQEKPDDKTTSS